MEMHEAKETNKEGFESAGWKKRKTEERAGINSYFLIGIVTLILLISVIQSFQLRSLKNTITTNAVADGSINMEGWTENEKMMYEHHGTLPSKVKQNSQQQLADMVGGC